MSDINRARLKSSRCNISGREFVIEMLMMTNGCFGSITEDRAPKIGAISISVKTEHKSVHSSSLIPDRRASLLGGMIGELLASKLGGIAVTSLYVREEIDAESMKTLINEVRKLLETELTSDP